MIKEIAKEIMNKIKGLHLVGSLARGEEGNDIDFVTTQTLPENRKYITFNYKGYQVDIWHTKDIKIGKFLRTYKKGYVIAVYKGLKENGYKLIETGIQNMKTGKVIPFTTKKAFQLAGLPFRPVKSSS